MPSAHTPSQKAAISQFVGFTQVKDSVAAKQLKSHGWNVEQAIDAFYHSSASSGGASASSGGSLASSAATTLNKQFDKYKDTKEDPNKIGAQGAMQYMKDLGVPLDGPVLLSLLTELGSPTFGEFERTGFVEGWTKLRADTLAKQKAHLPSLRRGLSENPDAFKKTYKNAFLLARSPGAKVVQLDEAINFWGIILSTPSLNWSTDTTPWLEWWIEFLQSKWKKSVGKDMWDQTGVFVHKSLEDESMSWWSEEGSWPGVIDEFVAFVKAKRDERVKAKRDEGVKMDTE